MVLKLLMYFLSLLKVTCLANSNFWTLGLFFRQSQTTFSLADKTSFHTHFISVNHF